MFRPGIYYIYITPEPELFKFGNWRPVVTKKALEMKWIGPCGVFSNTLSWIDDADLPPSERAFNAGFAVYTIEFDGMPLQDQLALIYMGKIKRINAQLRQYRDYRGFEVVYSGKKSLHFHFCFDLRHLKRELCLIGNSSYLDHWSQDLPDPLLRPAYGVCWDRLADGFRQVAEIDFHPDPRLRSWEQLRRCPWALRRVGDNHPLGLPYGHLTHQVVLASGIFQHMQRIATDWFHEAETLGKIVRPEHARRRKSSSASAIPISSGELGVFEQHAPEVFQRLISSDYPKFARAEISSTGIRCYFWNSETDRNPSSFCDGDRDRVLLQGRHGFDSDGVPLGATPNEIFSWIITRQAPAGRQHQDWINRQYRATVHDRQSLANFLDEHLVGIIAPPRSNPRPAWMEALLGREIQDTHSIIRGPQGCGKSTKVLSNISKIYENDAGVIFFSSPSLAQAEEKIDTFQRVNLDAQFIPFLYLSLTALYERFCPLTERIRHIDVLEEGGSSWLATIYEQQRHVYDAMFAYRCRLFDLRQSGKVPILFGTHETVRQHAGEGMTRIFYSESFDETWFEPMSLNDREIWRRDLITANHIHRVVLDEVTAHDLVSIHQFDIVQWVEHCALEIGFEQIIDLGEKFAKFSGYLSAHPFDDMSWDLFNEVLACRYTDEQVVTVSGKEVPFDETNPNGIYRRMADQRYYVGLRRWWNQFWRVSMLTTEAVPTRIVEAIDREATAKGETQDDRFRVYEFLLPECSRDTVTVELQRTCKKASLPDLVRAYRERFPDAEVISDMVKRRVSEFAVTTHLSAKGSNAFIDKEIVAFYTALSPTLFAELGALNSRFGRSDIVRLFYLDQFDQTCGRNRGFRGQNSCTHIAVLPPRLYNWLTLPLLGASYVPVMTKSRV